MLKWKSISEHIHRIRIPFQFNYIDSMYEERERHSSCREPWMEPIYINYENVRKMFRLISMGNKILLKSEIGECMERHEHQS